MWVFIKKERSWCYSACGSEGPCASVPMAAGLHTRRQTFVIVFPFVVVRTGWGQEWTVRKERVRERERVRDSSTAVTWMSPSSRTSGVREQAWACQRPTFPKYDSRPLSVLPLVGLQRAQRIRRTILFIACVRVRVARRVKVLLWGERILQ